MTYKERLYEFTYTNVITGNIAHDCVHHNVDREWVYRIVHIHYGDAGSSCNDMCTVVGENRGDLMLKGVRRE